MDQASTRVLSAARAFSTRWNDITSRVAADDIAQEAAIAAWLRRDTVRQPERMGAFVRTIVRRVRARTVAERMRWPVDSLDADPSLAKLLIDEPTPPNELRIDGRRVPLPWCLRELDEILPGLGDLNHHLLLSYYEGFSCDELADRYRVPVDVVKVRLHRCRARIRRAIRCRLPVESE